MSVQNETNRVQYWGNESTTTAYPVPFYFFENGDLRVVETNAAGVDRELAEGTDYSASGAGGESGGAILTITAVPATSRVTIYREVAAVQTTVYEENGEFPAKTHERALDRQTMLNQQNARAFDRALKVRESDGGKSSLTTVSNSVIGFGGDSQPRTFTPEQLAVWLNLTQQVFGEGTKAWLTDADRAMAVPDFPGQVGTQLDDYSLWIANGTSAGAWADPVPSIVDGSIATVKLADGIFSADSMGRAKMADAFLTLAKIGEGIFTADAAGRGKFASGFVDSGLCAAGLWNAIAPVGAVLQTVTAFNTTPAAISAVFPADSTKVQITEGTQILSVTLAPSSLSSKFVCRFIGGAAGSNSTGTLMGAAIFRVGVSDALAVNVATVKDENWYQTLQVECVDSPNAVSSQTFSVRLGPLGGNTMYINRSYFNSAYLGGVLGQSFIVQEIKG